MSVVEEEITLPVVTFKRQRVGNKVYLRHIAMGTLDQIRMHLQLKKTQNSKMLL